MTQFRLVPAAAGSPQLQQLFDSRRTLDAARAATATGHHRRADAILRGMPADSFRRSAADLALAHQSWLRAQRSLMRFYRARARDSVRAYRSWMQILVTVDPTSRQARSIDDTMEGCLSDLRAMRRNVSAIARQIRQASAAQAERVVLLQAAE